MEYYINPSWIYWINVVGSLHIAFIIFMFISGVLMLFGFPILWAEGVIEPKTFYKSEIISGVIIIISIFSIIFIPSKQTLIEMMIANAATKGNIELTGEVVKNIVDYVIETINKLK